jgi:HEAT repeat protein
LHTIRVPSTKQNPTKTHFLLTLYKYGERERERENELWTLTKRKNKHYWIPIFKVLKDRMNRYVKTPKHK